MGECAAGLLRQPGDRQQECHEDFPRTSRRVHSFMLEGGYGGMQEAVEVWPESRPKAQKKNASYVPPCPSSYSGPAIHPFRTPETYFTCLGALTGKNYA